MSLLHIAGGATEDKLYPEDVFSTYLYTGNGSNQTINNGIDLAGKGGLVWIKDRNTSSVSHSLWDTNQGRTKRLSSASTGASFTDNAALSSFNINGFSLNGSTTTTTNGSGTTYASWTFRKAPKFFDVQTKVHTNGVASTVDLSSLGEVGMVVVKATSATSDWYTWHRGLTAGNNLKLNLTAAQSTTNAYLSVSGTTLTIASTAPSATYVVYAWAHDPSADGIIQCGSFVGSTTVTIGWEPQYIMIKRTDSTGDWITIDSMRGCSVGGIDSMLNPNLSNAENVSNDYIDFTPTGFISKNLTGTYIYMVIRRPMKVPTSGTEVYNAVARTGTGAVATVTGVGFAPDMLVVGSRNAANGAAWWSKMQGVGYHLRSYKTDPETNSASTVTALGNNSSDFGADESYAICNYSGRMYINHFFKRAKGFFDVVCYTGTGASRTINHNLGVVPELIIVKSRSTNNSWVVYSASLGNTGRLRLEVNEAGSIGWVITWNSTNPTSTVLSVGTDNMVNASTVTYVAYLFASLPGISKVGSYTGNGSSQTINCGFSAGARFVLCKRTDSTGDWYIWDTARGIVAANDPHLSLNTSVVEVTTDDSVDPEASGFIVNQNTATNINVNGASYIFLAIS